MYIFEGFWLYKYTHKKEKIWKYIYHTSYFIIYINLIFHMNNPFTSFYFLFSGLEEAIFLTCDINSL